ncbi:MAG: hypothetical protein R2681_18490 [Pyrinomonadaceae bacterium]
MQIETHINLIDEILNGWEQKLGGDYTGYRNHVYRMLNFCFALKNADREDREKIVIAGCFHDLGIWAGDTFDYLPPSIVLAKDYLVKTEKVNWAPEIESMIGTHHKVRKYSENQFPATETFRQADLVDFSLGFIKCGLPRDYVQSVRREFPNAGFHQRILRLAAGRVCRHPLNPVPVLKW